MSRPGVPPRAAPCDVALRPALVSQHTCIVLGFKPDGRAYLAWLPKSGCPVFPRGKDRLVRLDDAVAALTRSPLANDADADDGAPDLATADGVLARLGLRRTR